MKTQKVYYYVAYGSNLNLRQMSMRCPNSQLIATGFLKGYELLFRGHDGNCFCTIEKCSNARVPVGIFKITERCKMALDRYEGYPTHYRTAKVSPKELIISQGNLSDCKELFVYVMVQCRSDYGRPSAHYYEVCMRGYRDCGLDARYLQEALQKTIARMPKPKRGYEEFWHR